MTDLEAERAAHAATREELRRTGGALRAMVALCGMPAEFPNWRNWDAAVAAVGATADFVAGKRDAVETAVRAALDGVLAGTAPASPSTEAAVRAGMATLTDEQRAAIFRDYCTSCGYSDPRCQCWNDE